MIEVKREFNNGLFDCQEIYDKDFQILETTNNHLWNTDENHPIAIAKSRRNDYVASNVSAEEIIDELAEKFKDEDDK